MTNTFKKSLLIVMACLGGLIVKAEDYVLDFSTQSTTHALFPINATLSQYEYSSNSKIAEWKLLEVDNGASLTITNATGATISAIKVEGVSDNNSNKSTTVKLSDGTTELTTGSSSWNNRKSTSMTTKNLSNVNKLKSTAGTTYTITNSGYKVGMRITITYSGGSGGGGTQPTTPTVSSVVIDPTSATLEPNDTKQLSVTVTASPDNADNKKVTWASDKTGVATVSENGLVTAVAQGTATITATSTIDNTKKGTCTITVNAPEQQIPAKDVSLNKTSTTIGVGATETLTVSFTPADANTGKEVTWASDNAAVTVDNNGTIKGVTAGGSANVTVTLNSDQTKKATCAVTVKEADPVPATTLKLHEPGVYEEKSVAGGYDAKLTVNEGREYEVYYMTRDGNSKFCISTTSADQTSGITTRSSDYECTANDGWFKFKGTGWSGEEKSLGGEFSTTIRRLDLDNSCEFSMHIKGFDQFAIIAKDKKRDDTSDHSKSENDRYLEVYINDVLQPQQFNTEPTIRRYNIPTSEQVIRIKHIGSEKSSMYAFSLRVSDQPRVRWLKGNDTTQTVLQTQAPKAVYYFTKYNAKGETKLEWEGQPATGITLEKAASATIGDTLVLGGVANCPVGEYKYNVVTYMNGAETSRVSGKLKVTSDIKASTDTLVDAYQGEEMEVIEFRYYALSANDVQLTWTNGTPTGITGAGEPNTNKYVISGTTSAAPGKYTYSITVNGSSTVITGYIEVISQDLGENPVLYLYQTKSPQRGYDNDGVFSYLRGKNVNLQPRTIINKLRSKEQYGKFKWILISDDVNADNAEVLEIARGGADLPVLNMKGFTYTEDRLGWGEPDNGSIDTLSHNGQYIYVQQAKHPIFNGFNAQTNSKIKIFDGLAQNGVMPINIDYPGSFALATAYTRDINNYYKDGELQTIIHEIPAGERNNKKYICFPLSISSSNKLSSEGKKLLTNIVDYLLSSEAASMTAPKLEMTAFKIGEYNGTIDQTNNTVDLVIDTDKYPDLDLKALKPIVSVADPMTHVSPASGAEVDFQYSLYMPVDYVVTDFINRRVYEVVVRAAASQGIEEVYSLGDWVNIYDVFGRKVATTNENIFTMELPKGMYIIVTENGNTLKIMR